MQNIAGFGSTVRLIASNTFPIGFSITQFADDGDPVDMPSIAITEVAMGLNGDLVVWSKANPLGVTINVIEGGDDDTNLAIVFEANRVGRGKRSANDVITLAVVYPNGRTITYSPGSMTNGQPGPSISSAGKLKSKQYMFKFENKSDTFV